MRNYLLRSISLVFFYPFKFIRMLTNNKYHFVVVNSNDPFNFDMLVLYSQMPS